MGNCFVHGGVLLAALLGAMLPGLALAQPEPGQEPVTVEVPMRDGTKLATDVYLPSGTPPWPTLLIRTPYGRGLPAEVARDYASVDLAVVVQDMRGRGDSFGTDSVYHSDGDGTLQDGYDTFQWIREQSWAYGTIASFGGSALGIVQYLQAASDPPGLVAMHPAAAVADLYDDIYFPGGVFRHQLVVQWLIDQGSSSYLEQIEAHPYVDAFWDPVQTSDRLDVVKVPALHLGGWYDIFTQGTIDAFSRYQHQAGPGARGRQKLVMGPWTHDRFHKQQQGQLRFPPQAKHAPYPAGDVLNTLLDEALGTRWDTVADNYDAIPPVQYYVMGDVDDPAAPGNQWRTVPDWPPQAGRVRLHLQAANGLNERCPPEAEAVSSYRYDPAHPVPTVGGANLYVDAGPYDQRVIEDRNDLVVFSTEVLSEPVEVTGRVQAHLFVRIDRPDTDLMVRLSDVYPDGRSMLVADGARRLATWGTNTGLAALRPSDVVEAVVDLGSTSIVFNRGHRIRVSISSSNFPRYERNRNNGLDFGAMQRGPSLPVQVELFRSSAVASYLELPQPGRAPSDFVRCGEGRPSDGEAGSDPASVIMDAGDGGAGKRPAAARGWLPPLLVALLVCGVLATGIVAIRKRQEPGRRD